MRKVFETTGKKDMVTPMVPARSPESLLVEGAVRAAKHSTAAVKQKILSDIAPVLGCRPNDLEFLFSSQNDNSNHEWYDFPDAERRRKIIRDNYPDAAE